MLPNEEFIALVSEIKNDPSGRGYLALYDSVSAAQGAEWCVFNTLRDPSPARLSVIGVNEDAMSIEDVREAIKQART